MNGRCCFLVVVCLVVLPDLSAAGVFLTFARKSNFCFWTSSISNGRTQYMFLHQSSFGKERSFVLFDSIWNKEDSLVECITSNNYAVIKSFSSKCWKAKDGPPSDVPDGRFNISMLFEPDGPCEAVGHLPALKLLVRRNRDLESMDRTTVYQSSLYTGTSLKHAKRALLIPGTLWCGSGNKASHFSDLGLFEETDKCCRAHDHCDQTIASFEFGYGIFNTNFFTLSHCACDSKFHRCLHDANDNMSGMVGYGYFNLLKMRCFEFSQRMECAERTWWGMCKHSQMTTYARLRNATDYNSTFQITEDNKLSLSIHHTVSFEDIVVPNDAMKSSDVVTAPHRLSVSVNTSQQLELWEKTKESLKKHTDLPHNTVSPHIQTTNLSQRQTTVLPHNQTTDSSQRQTDLPHKQTTDSSQRQTDLPHKQTTDSSQRQTDLPHKQTTDSSQRQTTVLPHNQTTDSSQRQTDLPHKQTTDSSQRQTTDLPHKQTTDSSQRQTTDLQHKQTTDSSQRQTTDLPHKQTTDSSQRQTDLPHKQTTDSSQRQTTDLQHKQTTDSSQRQTTDLPHKQTTDSSQRQTDSSQRQTTDSLITESTDTPQEQIDLSTTQITNTPKTGVDSPKTETSHLSKTQTMTSPRIKTTDAPKTQTRDFTETKITDPEKPEITGPPQIRTTDSSKPQTAESAKPQPTNSSVMHIHPEMHPRQKGNLEACESYKDLDSCPYQIPPLREKFGVRNNEHTTLYHCNCTARLARELAEHVDEVDKVHFWLLDFVSQSCFYLPQNCTGSESCSTSSTTDAPLIERWSGAAVWRHLAAPRRKARRFNPKRCKRKDSPIRLHKKCLRMHSKLNKPKPLKSKVMQQLYS